MANACIQILRTFNTKYLLVSRINEVGGSYVLE